MDDESQAFAFNANWQAGGRTAVGSRFYWTGFEEKNVGVLVSSQSAQPVDTLHESLVKGDASISHVLGERHLLQAGAEISGNAYEGINRVRDESHSAKPGATTPGSDPPREATASHEMEAFAAVDNMTDSQDPNTGVLLPAGTPAPIYRAEIGRTIRFGVRWTFDKK